MRRPHLMRNVSHPPPYTNDFLLVHRRHPPSVDFWTTLFVASFRRLLNPRPVRLAEWKASFSRVPIDATHVVYTYIYIYSHGGIYCVSAHFIEKTKNRTKNEVIGNFFFIQSSAYSRPGSFSLFGYLLHRLSRTNPSLVTHLRGRV